MPGCQIESWLITSSYYVSFFFISVIINCIHMKVSPKKSINPDRSDIAASVEITRPRLQCFLWKNIPLIKR